MLFFVLVLIFLCLSLGLFFSLKLVRMMKKAEDAEGVLFWKLIVTILVVATVTAIIWTLQLFDVIEVYGPKWNPSVDNKVSPTIEAPPKPTSPPPLTEKEATKEAVEEHNDALREFEGK